VSLEKLEQFLRTVRDDDAFAAQVGSDPALIQGYGLDLRERSAVLEGDLDALRELGVSEDLLPTARQAAHRPQGGTSTAL
jgi:hypothetical protein